MKIKSLFYSLTFLLITTEVLAQTDAQLTSIDKIQLEIKNNIANFQKVEKFKNNNLGYRYVYLKDKEIQLITLLAKDGSIDKNVEWYFSKGQLIYSQQIWTDTTTGKIVDNEKFYLSNGQLIAWINGEKTIDNSSQEFKDANNQLIAYIDKLKQDEK